MYWNSRVPIDRRLELEGNFRGMMISAAADLFAFMLDVIDENVFA